MAIWIFKCGAEWEIIEPDQRHGQRFVEFGEALRVAEHLAAQRGQDLVIHFRPFANPTQNDPSWS